MPIGDDLFKGVLGQQTVFTDAIANSGVQLIPSSATDTIQQTQATQDTQDTQGLQKVEPLGPVQINAVTDTAAGQELFPQNAGRSTAIFSPEDLRPLNPFDPTQRVAPEDDSTTAEGNLSNSENAEAGKFLGKLGDVLSSPLFTKGLAAFGMALAPGNTVAGEIGLDLAESKAQQRFRQKLESGESAGDILAPGLSTQGRQSVLTQFNEEKDQDQVEAFKERELEQNQQLLDIRERSQDFKFIIDKSNAASNRISALAEKSYRDSQKNGTLSKKDGILALNRTTQMFIDSLEFDTREVEDLDTEIRFLVEGASTSSFLPFGIGDETPSIDDPKFIASPYYQKNIKPLLEYQKVVQARVRNSKDNINRLNVFAFEESTEQSANIIDIASEAEAEGLPINSVVRLPNGEIMVVK